MSRSAAPYLALLLLGIMTRCCAQQTAATYVPSWAPYWARPLYSAQLQLELAEMQRDDQKVRLVALPWAPMAASSVSLAAATPARAQRSTAQPPLPATAAGLPLACRCRHRHNPHATMPPLASPRRAAWIS